MALASGSDPATQSSPAGTAHYINKFHISSLRDGGYEVGFAFSTNIPSLRDGGCGYPSFRTDTK
ncbi:MAG: hypothetical protein LBD59_06010 [Prevotellaceae bacterium]|nr:hypothetical protein [Prevotellaceae bacterium]